jgi:hypothetical protein
MVAWEGSRLKMVWLDVLPTYKKVVAWLLSPLMNTERYFLRLRRLNRGLDTGHWTVYERKRNPMDSALCSVLKQFPTPHWNEWGGYPSGRYGKLSSPFWAPSRKGRNKKRKERRSLIGLY